MPRKKEEQNSSFRMLRYKKSVNTAPVPTHLVAPLM